MNEKIKKNRVLDIFKNEWEISERTEIVGQSTDVSISVLHDEYRQLSRQYKKLLKEIMKITRVGDVNYKKLMDANEQVRRQKGELEVLNKELRASNALKDRFYSIIAHDLRNPLQFLLLSTGLLHSDFNSMDKASAYKYITKTYRTVKNLSELLENLLQWSRSQYGKIECQPHHMDISSLVDEAIRYHLENAEKKGITLSSTLQNRFMVYADRDMIHSVMRNLVGNAVKFTKVNGRITISAKADNQWATISVADTGVGIHPEKLQSIFTLGNYTTEGTDKEKGTGLGLILCKEFIEKNGGTIHVSSEPEKGSTFEFTLPIANQ